VAGTQIFYDDFGDGTPLPTLAGNGSVTESGGDEIVTISAAQNADWWTSGRNGILAYKSINDFRTADEKIIRFETEHSAIVPDPATAQSHTMWGLRLDDGNFVYLGYDGTNVWAGWTSGFAAWSASGSIAVSTPFKMRIFWDIEAQNVRLLVETSAGSWQQLYSLDIGHNFQQAFFYSKNYGALPAIQGQWSYLDVYSVTADAEVDEPVGMVDQITTPSVGGEGTGYNLPGSSEQQGQVDTASVENAGGDPAWWDPDTIGTVYAALRFGPAELRVRNANTSEWSVDLTPAVNTAPHGLREAPDGTLWMIVKQFFTGDEIWRKLPEAGEEWTFISQGTGGLVSMTALSPVSKDEVWVSTSQWLGRWTSSGGWTHFHMATEVGTFRFYEATVFAYASNHVISIGHDNSGLNKYVGYYDGVSWSLEATLAVAGYPISLYGNGNDLWYGNGNSARLLHHPAKGVGTGWTEITNGSWPSSGSLNGIFGTATDLWITIGNSSSAIDVAHTVDNGSNWTNYVRNAGLGCTSVYGDTAGNVFVGHVDASRVSIWNGAWRDEDLGGGSFGGWLYGTGSYARTQQILIPEILPLVGKGVGYLTPQASEGIPDAISQTLGFAQYSAEQATTDSEAHPHFIGRRPYRLFYYDAVGDAWSNPITAGFTGYARDGTRYTNGVQDAGPVYAPWYSETAGSDRSSVGAFPSKVLISATRSEITIFDFANYPTDLDVWMRFRLGDSGTFKLIGRIDESITDVCFNNGVLCVVTQWNGIENGGLFLIDFRQNDQRFINLIRADNHWFGVGGRDITDRDIGGNFTTSGVSPSLRLEPEYIGSVSAHSLADGSKMWVAVGGEDPGIDLFEVDASGVPQIRSVSTGDGIGGYDLSSRRQVLFDRDGWLWHTVEGRLYRNGLDYQEGVIQSWLDQRDRYPHVDLGTDIVDLVDSENFIYAATARGVYRIARGSLDTRLMWTIAGGGGLGLAGTPGAGEILVGEDPEVEQIRAFTVKGSGYIGVAVKLDGGLSGGVTLIRTSDDAVVDSMQVPDLAEDGSYVIQPVGL